MSCDDAGPLPVISLLLAVLAATCNAVSSVAQRVANRDETDRRAFSLSQALHLLSRPVWLLGGAAMIASLLLQATALKLGTLSAVEPVLVLELPMALVLGAAVLHKPLRRRGWTSAVVMAAGLAMLIAALDPKGGDAAGVPTTTMLAAMVATLAGIALLVLLAQHGPDPLRSALFGAAAGSSFGLTAALLKTAMARTATGGFAGLFTTWETYATAVVGVFAVGLVQAALHVGTLVTAQPGITLLDPLVSLLWGTVVADERTRTGPAIVFATLGALLIAVGVLRLARAGEGVVGGG